MMKKLYFLLLISASLALAGQESKVGGGMRAAASGPVINVTDQSEKNFSIGGGEGFITLNNLPQGETTIRIVALTGKVVKTIDFSDPQATEKIDLKNYPAGIYLVNVQNKNGFQAVRKAYLR